MTKKTDFVFSNASEPHRIRTKQILKQFPQMRNLIGKNPKTIFAILLLVGIQVGMAFVLHNQSWWFIFAAAYFIGAFADHTLFVIIHEFSHHL
ncbi:MAG: fatty acid desaturase, partial [Mucilaginibacter sp.]